MGGPGLARRRIIAVRTAGAGAAAGVTNAVIARSELEEGSCMDARAQKIRRGTESSTIVRRFRIADDPSSKRDRRRGGIDSSYARVLHRDRLLRRETLDAKRSAVRVDRMRERSAPSDHFELPAAFHSISTQGESHLADPRSTSRDRVRRAGGDTFARAGSTVARLGTIRVAGAGR